MAGLSSHPPIQSPTGIFYWINLTVRWSPSHILVHRVKKCGKWNSRAKYKIFNPERIPDGKEEINVSMCEQNEKADLSRQEIKGNSNWI